MPCEVQNAIGHSVAGKRNNVLPFYPFGARVDSPLYDLKAADFALGKAADFVWIKTCLRLHFF